MRLSRIQQRLLWLLVYPAALKGAPTSSTKSLTGRFLSISDIHLDYHYKQGKSIAGACHRHRPVDQDDVSPYWGAPASDCDAPATLVDAVFHDLEQWRDKIDFVVWMGDNARHDIDSAVPRTLNEIIDLNQDIYDRMQQVFPDLPLVPSIGNNDVYPHNVMSPGPSKTLSSLGSIWRDDVPEEQYHTFARGGYFGTEVIPDHLVVVSVNTLFFFQSNSLVDGCPPDSGHGTRDPGTEQLLWLQNQLSRWRSRGMQVILSGHVPPATFYPQCYDRFAEISLAYQDTIVASIFGHQNVDHFTLFTHQEKKKHRKGFQFSINSVADLPDTLHDSYSNLPKQPHPDNYVINHVAPSVIPNFQPAYRIWSYNTSMNSGSIYEPSTEGKVIRPFLELPEEEAEDEQICQQPFYPTSIDELKKRKSHKKKKHRKPSYDPLVRYISPSSPSRSNRFATILGYVQHYLPLDKVNAHHGYGSANRTGERPWPKFEVEYSTFTRSRAEESGIEGKTPYQMEDLTIGSWLAVAKRLGKGGKFWDEFVRRMFVQTGKHQS